MAWAPSTIFGAVAAVSLIVVIGWQVHVPALVTLLPKLPPIRFNCALLQFFSAISLLLLDRDERRGSLLVGSILTVFSSLFFFENLFGYNLGVDALFASTEVFSRDAHPGRISFAGSIGFLSIGISCLLLTIDSTRKSSNVFVTCSGLLCLLLGTSAAFALWLGLRDPGHITRFNGITPQGSAFFTFLGVGILWQLGNQLALRERGRRAADSVNASLAALVQHSDDAIYSIDLEGNLLSWNRGAQNLYGYSPREMIGTSVLRLSPRDGYEAVWSAIDQVKQGVSLCNFEGWRLKKNGEKLLLSFTVSPVRDDSGDIVQLSIVGRDITEKKNSQEQIQRLALELSRSNQELEQFAAVASHDLQEPLRMISSYLMLLTQRYQQKLDQDAKDFIHFAVDGASRMKMLVEGLLSYSRVGSKTLRVKQVDVQMLTKKVLLNLQECIRENHAEIAIGELPTITADEIQLLQVFQNLISNAIKYRREETPRVRVEWKRAGAMHVFSISDNGVGISARDRDRLFKLFHRLHYRERIPGTGIGLATCKKIVERHGGDIWVESEENRGTTFFFSVPDLVSPRTLSENCQD